MATLGKLIRQVAKLNNADVALNAKIIIRRNVLAAIGADRAHVFDAFAGHGELHRAVWQEARSYVGCEMDESVFSADDPRLGYVCDNLRLMRCIPLARYNIFDLDAYGSPWEQVYILASRRKLQPGEAVGLVLTEGQGMKLKMGGMSLAMSLLTGIKSRMPDLGRSHPELIDRALTRVQAMMGGTITKRWETVGKKGSARHYLGMVIEAPALPG